MTFSQKKENASSLTKQGFPKKVLNTKELQDEIYDETYTVTSKILNFKEGLEFLFFKLKYFLFKKNNSHKLLSKYIIPYSPLIKGLQRKKLNVDGKNFEDAKNEYLTKKEQDEFSNLGVLGPFKATISDKELEKNKTYCINHRAQIFSHFYNEHYLNLILDKNITKKIASILGDDAEIIRSSIFVKDPGTPNDHTRWHMATPINYGASEDKIKDDDNDFVTVWIALSEAKIQNGCLKIVPKSYGIYPSDLIPKVIRKDLIFDSDFDAFLFKKIFEQFYIVNKCANKSTLDKFLSNRVNAVLLIQKMLDTNHYLQSFISEHELEAYALEAQQKEFYMFVSENYHASFPNVSDSTRVACAVRFGRKSTVINNIGFVKTGLDTLPDYIKEKCFLENGELLTPIISIDSKKEDGRDGNKYYFSKDTILKHIKKTKAV